MATINNHNTHNYLNEKQTILIVDDSKVIRLALNKILKNDFIVIQANDGEDAWDKLLENEAVAGIFSDVSMPNLDGFGLLDRVRSSDDSHIAELPFIIITANDDDPGFSSKVTHAGGNDLITKPFKTNEIKACIQNHIAIEVAAEIETTDNIPEIPDNEVAEILGIDGIDAGDNLESTHLISEKTADISIDTDILNISEAAPVENTDNLIAENSLEEVPVVNASDNLSSVDDIDFSIDESLVDAVQNTSDNPLDTFELSIDEELLDENINSAHKDSVSEPQIPNTHVSTEVTKVEDEVPVASKADMLASNKIPEASNKELEDSTSNLEQARQHAMKVAQEKIQPPSADESSIKARQTAERDQIRTRLQQIREQEKLDVASARNARRLIKIGDSTSLLSKLGRIISKWVFRKK